MVALQGSLRNMFYISIIHMHIFFVLKQALRKKYAGHAVVAHAFNRRTQEAEAGGSLSSRSAWSTESVPRQPELHRKILSWKTKQNKL